MRRASWLMLGMGLALSACAGSALQSSFDAQEVAWSLRDGKNRIEGDVRILLPNGEVRTCGSYTPVAIPVSPYASERVQAVFGTTASGTQPVGQPAPRLEPDYPAYHQSKRTTHCDTDGHFAFTGLPDGEWYITVPVIWQDKLGQPFRGATFMKRVAVKDGRTMHITMGYAEE